MNSYSEKMLKNPDCTGTGLEEERSHRTLRFELGPLQVSELDC